MTDSLLQPYASVLSANCKEFAPAHETRRRCLSLVRERSRGPCLLIQSKGIAKKDCLACTLSMRRVGFLNWFSDFISLLVATGGSERRAVSGGRGVKDRRFGDEFQPHGDAFLPPQLWWACDALVHCVRPFLFYYYYPSRSILLKSALMNHDDDARPWNIRME
jgi:hypothetical protein